MKFSKNAF